jgi:murein hydrolase activator
MEILRKQRPSPLRLVTVAVTLAACAVAAAGVDLPQADAPGQAGVETQARRTAERLRALQAEADTLASRERSLLLELRRLEVERDLKAAELEQILARRARMVHDHAETVARIDQLEKSASGQRPLLRARFVELYKLRGPGYFRLLLGVDSVHNASRAYRVMAALAAIDRERIDRHLATILELRAARTELERQHAETEELQKDLERARLAAQRAVDARAHLIRQIDARRDLNAELVGELQAAHQKLQALARTSHVPAAASTVVLPLRPFQGVLDWPVRGKVRHAYGRHSDARTGVAFVRDGIEIDAAEGTPVAAIHDGSVAYAEPFTGFGNLVVVDHGNQCFSLYGHLSSLDVDKGTSVRPGHVIGRVGTAPAGPAGLYFELRIDGRTVDPVQWLRR